jgi:amphi-Trp domain-containing protein
MRFKRTLNRDEAAEFLRTLGYGFAKGKLVVEGGLEPSKPILLVGPVALEFELREDGDHFRIALKIEGLKGRALDIGNDEGTAETGQGKGGKPA